MLKVIGNTTIDNEFIVNAMKVIENTTIDNELIISTKLTMSGEIIVNGNIVVKENAHLTIRGATLYFSQDCGIVCEGLFEAINSTFDAKGLTWGEICIEETHSSNSIMKNCSILNGKGLRILNTSNIVIDSCTFNGCKDKNHGGIVSSGENITIRNCKILDCESEVAEGGGIFAGNGTSVEKCTIENCKASRGGGLYAYNGLVKECIIKDCKAKYGAGIEIEGNGKIINCKISQCVAEYNGGGIRSSLSSEDSLFIESSTISKCTSRTGGGMSIDSKGIVLFDNVEIIECNAAEGGGMSVGLGADVQSSSPTKIIRCKSQSNILGKKESKSNAMVLEPSDGSLKVDNFLFIDCIEDMDSNEEHLLELSSMYGGYAEVNNCKAYNTLSDGSIQEYKIEDFSMYPSSDNTLCIDGEEFSYRKIHEEEIREEEKLKQEQAAVEEQEQKEREREAEEKIIEKAEREKSEKISSLKESLTELVDNNDDSSSSANREAKPGFFDKIFAAFNRGKHTDNMISNEEKSVSDVKDDIENLESQPYGTYDICELKSTYENKRDSVSDDLKTEAESTPASKDTPHKKVVK